MADSERKFAFTVMVDGHSFSLLERRDVNDMEKIYRLSVDGDRAVFVLLPSWCSPSLAYHEGWFVIWAGSDLCFYNCETRDLTSFHMDEPVGAVYPVGDRWCVIRELSVVLFDVQLGREVAAYDHGEILMGSWWDSGRLFVEDFEGRTVQFDFSRPGSELVPVEG